MMKNTPGPLAPPDNNLPSLKMTDLSYSWKNIKYFVWIKKVWHLLLVLFSLSMLRLGSIHQLHHGNIRNKSTQISAIWQPAASEKQARNIDHRNLIQTTTREENTAITDKTGAFTQLLPSNRNWEKVFICRPISTYFARYYSCKLFLNVYKYRSLLMWEIWTLITNNKYLDLYYWLEMRAMNSNQHNPASLLSFINIQISSKIDSNWPFIFKVLKSAASAWQEY